MDGEQNNDEIEQDRMYSPPEVSREISLFKFVISLQNENQNQILFF
jgi:hypothetical protein